MLLIHNHKMLPLIHERKMSRCCYEKIKWIDLVLLPFAPVVENLPRIQYLMQM